MSTVREIKRSIATLTAGEREDLYDWLQELIEQENRIGEPPAEYSVARAEKYIRRAVRRGRV